MRTVRDLVAAFEALAPTAWAEPWDNTGLLLGDPAAPLGEVLAVSELFTRTQAREPRISCTIGESLWRQRWGN